MDEAARRFRQDASHELGDRQGAARRYSQALRQAAVAYWRQRERAGDGLGAVATALGVAPVSLRRWAHGERFSAVRVVPDPAPMTRVTVVIDGASLRVEGLDMEAAVQLLTRLR
jgi:transposase-like protein